MIDTIFDLGGLAVDAASELVVDAAGELAVDAASNLSGILEKGLAEVAGLHLTMVPRAWDLVAETLEKNLGGDDKGSADA